MEHGQQWIGRGREESLQFVALGEPEACDAFVGRIQGLELAAQRPQPCARANGIAPGIDDVAEQDDPA
jgi:hypothetical protein